MNLNVGDVLSACDSTRFDGEIVNVLYFRRETVKGQNEGVALTLPSGAKNALFTFLSWKAEALNEAKGQAGESLSKRAPLFLSRQGGRLTRQQAHNAFKKAYKKVGLKGHVTTHSPRKTYAQMVYDNSGSDLVVAQRALRHTDIQSTLYYLDTLADDVTAAMPNFYFSEGLSVACDSTRQTHGTAGDIDIFQKTSKSKVIEMPKPKKTQTRKKHK